VPYLSASAAVIHYEEALYQVYGFNYYFFCNSKLDGNVAVRPVSIRKGV